MFDNLPIFGICGFSGSGKTNLIEKLVPRLSANGLKVAVVKYDVHGIVVDKPGKDSDRFFRSGADVLLNSPEEEFFRVHSSDDSQLSYTLLSLSQYYDLILVEGGKNTPLTKVWLMSDGESEPPSDINGIIAVLPWDTDRVGKVISILDDWLPGQWMKPPVFGCVLVGGRNNRMGTAKHLLIENGKTWLEKKIELLKHVCHRVVIVGDGTVTEMFKEVVRLPDIPDIQGPMAGILSAMRWAPHVSWLVTACDLPNLSLEALEWLLSFRGPGIWAIIPHLKGSKGIEPLLAHYDFRARVLLEKLAIQGIFRPGKIADNPKVVVESPPDHLAAAWVNINTKAELKTHRSKTKRSFKT